MSISCEHQLFTLEIIRADQDHNKKLPDTIFGVLSTDDVIPCIRSLFSTFSQSERKRSNAMAILLRLM